MGFEANNGFSTGFDPGFWPNPLESSEVSAVAVKVGVFQ
jgi:hypothetical protein